MLREMEKKVTKVQGHSQGSGIRPAVLVSITPYPQL